MKPLVLLCHCFQTSQNYFGGLSKYFFFFLGNEFNSELHIFVQIGYI